MLQLKATEADELRHQVSGLRDSNAYLQESIAQARFRSDDPLREVELADLRELVEDLKAELEDSQAEVDSLSGVGPPSSQSCDSDRLTIPIMVLPIT